MATFFIRCLAATLGILTIVACASPAAVSAPEPSPSQATIFTPTHRPDATPTPTTASPAQQPPTPTPLPALTQVPSPTPTTTTAISSSPTPTSIAKTLSLDCTPHSFPQRTQSSLAVDPTNDQLLYIGVEQEGFFKSTDGGATWKRASTGIKAWNRLGEPGLCYEEFYSTIIDPKNPGHLCISMAGGPGTIRLVSSAGNNGVYCSNDAATTWTQMVSPTMNTAVYALAADPTDFSVIYAGVNGGACSNPPPVCQPNTYFNTIGAIYKTIDGGKSWTELNALYMPNLRVITIRIDQQSPKTVYAATFSKLSVQGGGAGNFQSSIQLGLLKSTDGGMTWTSSNKGMNPDPREQALLGMDVSPNNGSLVYVTASSNASYWSSDGGAAFNKADRMAAFAFDPHDPTGLHMLGCSGELIKESRDGGKSWTVKSKTPGFISIEKGTPTRIEWSKASPNTVFLAGPYATIFKSVDSGATWAQILSADKLPR